MDCKMSVLKRIYADNFKCLVNFDWQPGPALINLMLGPNGSGKTTVFDCLDRVRKFATGEEKSTTLFPSSALTAWQNVSKQRFEVELEREGYSYRYELEIVHSEKRSYNHVSHERLECNGKPLLEFAASKATVYAETLSQPMFKYPVADNYSAVSLLPTSGLYERVTEFKVALSRLTVLQIIPPMMEDTGWTESLRPLRYFENFVSWYRAVSQNHGMVIQLEQELKEVLPGFHHFYLESSGEAKLLKAVFEPKGKHLTFGLLSDGQRMLVALYAILYGLTARPEWIDTRIDDQSGALLCLDEPDNFIASREIQPWPAAAQDLSRRAEPNGQRLSPARRSQQSRRYPFHIK